MIDFDFFMSKNENKKNKITLYGPTNMATIVHTAADISRSYQRDNSGYLILLVLTDGEITDMDRTIGEIVEASTLPLSIVIVGIGDADFTKMNVLDADDVPLEANGKTMTRDIVQFVPFREYGNGFKLFLIFQKIFNFSFNFFNFLNHKILIS